MTTATVTIRPACLEDAETVLRWRNDPLMRAMAFDSREIGHDEHMAWFARNLTPHGNIRMHVAEDAGAPVAFVYFNHVGNGSAVVSINVAPAHRDKGIGTSVLQTATECEARDSGLRAVEAHIKCDNVASLRAFAKAGYVEHSRTGDRALLVYTPC